eukprot:g624.t1
MRVLVKRVASAAVFLEGSETAIESIENGGLLVYAWCGPKDTKARVRKIAGRIIAARLFREGAASVKDEKLQVLFLVYRPGMPSDAQTSSGIGEGIGGGQEMEGDPAQRERFRQIFKELVFRAQVDYTPDKKLRSEKVRGCVMSQGMTVRAELDDKAVVLRLDSGGPGKAEAGGASEKQPRTKSSSGKVQSRSVPLHLPKEDPGKALPVAVTPAIEKEHVHAVYDTIAEHWDHTRYAPWPQVASFLQSLPHGSLIADVGCGNGKYMQPAYIGRPVAAGRVLLGSDRSSSLLQICASRKFEVALSDNMSLPYRDGVFDAAISIAVLHHFSSDARRIRALTEIARIVRDGGTMLVYAWAQEQGSESRRRFETQDVLVPWHMRERRKRARLGAESSDAKVTTKEGSTDAAAVTKKRDGEHITSASGASGTFDEKKRSTVYQRYCHVYQRGDLEKLMNAVPGVIIEKTYFDTSNWAVRATVSKSEVGSAGRHAAEQSEAE